MDIEIVKKLVAGFGSLIVLTIITFIIVNTMLDADLFTRGTVSVHEHDAWINGSGYTLSNFSSNGEDYAIVTIWNATSNTGINLANITINQYTGVVTNTSILISKNVTFNYTYTYKGSIEQSPNSMAGNLTGGVDNISEKIPTILLIAAVVLLFGILVILVMRSKNMGIGVGNSTL
jgi:hypothetical protein